MAYELNIEAAEACLCSRDKYSTPGSGGGGGLGSVAGAIGPTAKHLSVTEPHYIPELVESYEEQAQCLLDRRR